MDWCAFSNRRQQCQACHKAKQQGTTFVLIFLNICFTTYIEFLSFAYHTIKLNDAYIIYHFGPM